jgi:hypothetical protein
MLAEVLERFNVIEECYEFTLAYAAQGLPNDRESHAGGQIRNCLGRAAGALDGLAERCNLSVIEEGIEPIGKFKPYLAVLDRDARDSLAAIELVLAQPAISSQLVDNLNASIHLRALLTDLFLIGEVLRATR